MMNDMGQLEWSYAHTVPVAVAVLVNTTIIESVLVTPIGSLTLLVLISVVFPILMPWLLAPIQRKQGGRVHVNLSSLKSLGLNSIADA